MMHLTRRIGLAFAVLGLVAGAAGQVQAAPGLTIDTSDAWAGSVNNGWEGSGQSLTVESGFETFDDIGFYFDDDSLGRTFDFFLTDSLNGGTTLFSTSFTVQSGINVIGINQQFTAGQQVFALLDYNGFMGRTAHFVASDVYAGGNSSFGPVGSQINSPEFDHRFIANFSSTEAAAVPEPATLATAGLGVLMGLGYACRRRKRAAVA